MNDDTASGHLLKHTSNGVYTPTTEPRNPKWGLLLTVTAVAMTVGTAIPVGYNIGVMNSPAEFMRQWCNRTIKDRYDLDISEAQLETLWSTIISIFLVGGCIGSIIAATLADKYGRKGSLLMCGILFTIGALLFFLCHFFSMVELMIVGRLVVGLSSGMTTAILGMYLSEIAPSELRGTLAVFSALGVTGGVVVGQIASLQEVFGTNDLWQYALCAYVVLVVVFCFVPYKWLPESPKYLYIVAGRRDVARNELMRLRVSSGGSDELQKLVNAELAAMEQEASAQGETRSISSVLADKKMLLPLVLICALQCGQQLSGINAVFYYSVTIFKKAGLDEVNAKWANFGAGLLNLLVALSGPKVMEKINRRPIIIFSCLFSGLFLVILAVVVKFIEVVPWFSIACVFAVFSYIIAFQIGLGPIPYFIGSELIEISSRSAANSLGSFASWGGNFLVGMTFLPIQTALGGLVFLPFAIVCFLLTLLTYIYLPETRGREPSDVAPLVEHGFRSNRRF